MNRHLGPKVIHDCISFARAGKEVDATVRIENGKALRHGIARDIGATNVQKPRDRVGQGQDCRSLSIVPKAFGKAGPFVAVAFPGKGIGLYKERCGRRGRAVGPNLVDQIGAGDHICLFTQPFNLADRM